MIPTFLNIYRKKYMFFLYTQNFFIKIFVTIAFYLSKVSKVLHYKDLSFGDLTLLENGHLSKWFGGELWSTRKSQKLSKQSYAT